MKYHDAWEELKSSYRQLNNQYANEREKEYVRFVESLLKYIDHLEEKYE